MWQMTITVTNLTKRRVRATATRTEGESVRIFTLDTIVPDGVTVEQASTGLANRVWELYQAELADESAKATVVAEIASAATTKLDAKEAA